MFTPKTLITLLLKYSRLITVSMKLYSSHFYRLNPSQISRLYIVITTLLHCSTSTTSVVLHYINVITFFLFETHQPYCPLRMNIYVDGYTLAKYCFPLLVYMYIYYVQFWNNLVDLSINKSRPCYPLNCFLCYRLCQLPQSAKTFWSRKHLEVLWILVISISWSPLTKA